LYEETRGAKRKEEVRITIYHNEKISDGKMYGILEQYFSDIGFEIPTTRVQGEELNAETDDFPQDLDKFVCRLFFDDKEYQSLRRKYDNN